MRHTLICIALLFTIVSSARADSFDDLAHDFWNWRTVHQPNSVDDIQRLERPADWAPDWQPATIHQQRQKLLEFERRWRQIHPSLWPVTRQVDYRLIGSAIARVRWELEITRNWQRNPRFYLEQTLSALFEYLLQPPPFDAKRSRAIVRCLVSMPQTLAAAQKNLTAPTAPFAKLALDELSDIRTRLLTISNELKPLLTPDSAAQLDAVTHKAIVAFEAYQDWLRQRLPSMTSETAVGHAAYAWFLKHVALMPFTPEQLLAMGRQEWERAVAFEAYEQNRNAGLPQLQLFPDQAAQIAGNERDENAIRRFLAEKNILTVPTWMQHYRNLPLPTYLRMLPSSGEADDFTSPNRLQDDGIRYIVKPAPTLGYFALSTARDPRPIIVHEGVPGHYLQLVLSYAHENWLRRHYYDSGANEGIGFYAEEMLLQAGLFDDSPRTREIMYNFMRLRALRVEVDVKLATGQFTIAQGAEYLQKAVPMDAATALDESAFFASTPGQAITYQIGKLQIMRFLADARRLQGDKFNLRAFHDFVWKNGNVPIALQRWEYLGLKDEIEWLRRSRQRQPIK
jgi:hypothetical protein